MATDFKALLTELYTGSRVGSRRLGKHKRRSDQYKAGGEPESDKSDGSQLHVDRAQELGIDKKVCKKWKDGAEILWRHTPKQSERPNFASVEDHLDVVDKELSRLEKLGKIVKWNTISKLAKPHVV